MQIATRPNDKGDLKNVLSKALWHSAVKWNHGRAKCTCIWKATMDFTKSSNTSQKWFII